MKANSGKIAMLGLVRDVNGKPKFDNIFNIPDKFWNLLTKEEKEEVEHDRSSHRRSS